ncbi:MAG: hypothetical protein H7A01_06865 [Hahellaceae bacterium]|nr:hypothetical protein [Hahellaceae bacterium]MCP5211765.1 hypothetical protein [Hahellaceae bacterium]
MDAKSEAHYSYAFYLGSGIYQVNDQKAAIFNIPFTHMFVNDDEEIFTLRFPLSIGLFGFDKDSIKDLDIPSRADTVSLALGAEKTWISDNDWTLTPYADAGYTWSDTTDQKALLYSIGARLNKHFVAFERMHLWGNRLFMAGHKDLGLDTQGSFAAWETGIDWELPWHFNIGPAQFNTHAYGAAYWYLIPVKFFGREEEEKVKYSVEAGLSVSSPLLSNDLWIPIDRLGLGVRAGDGIYALKFVMGMPF